MTWEHLIKILAVVLALVILREIIALVFWRGRDESGNTDTRDPEGGTIGKMFNWHKRTVVNTSIRPDLGKDKTTASGYVEKSTVIRKAKR